MNEAAFGNKITNPFDQITFLCHRSHTVVEMKFQNSQDLIRDRAVLLACEDYFAHYIDPTAWRPRPVDTDGMQGGASPLSLRCASPSVTCQLSAC